MQSAENISTNAQAVVKSILTAEEKQFLDLLAQSIINNIKNSQK